MATSNLKRVSNQTKESHANWIGGPSFFRSDPIVALRLAASSLFFGEPMYYHTDAADTRKRKLSRTMRRATLNTAEIANLRSTLNAIDPQEWRSLTPVELMERTIDQALAFDAEATLKEAARLRQQEHVRTTPQVILVRAANLTSVKGTGLITKYAPQIIQRADEPSVGLAYQLAKYGKPIPNSLKKAWAASLKSFDAYQLAKYRQSSRQVKTHDVVNLTHAFNASLDSLMRDTLRTTGETWEAIISERGSHKESWLAALDEMGHMALLRNLRNLIENSVPEAAFTDKLIAGVRGGKQLPFRYYSAYQAIEKSASPNLLNALEDCLTLSFENAPKFAGRVMSLCDNSGSAWGTTTSSMGTMHISQIANLTGVITGMNSDEGYVGFFGDLLETMPIRKKDSIFSTIKTVDQLGDTVGSGTEHGIWLFWDQALRNQEHWDSVFIYSDMQAGHGGLRGNNSAKYRDYIWSQHGHYIDVPKLIQTYRQTVNPNVMVYLVQVAGYSDTILPEYYDRTYILGGWGEGLLRFAASMSQITSDQDAKKGHV